MSVKVTVGQQTFIKKIVLGTPVTTARETLSIDEFTDFDVATKSDAQILVFDSSEGVFKNFTFDVGQGLAREYSPADDKLIIGIEKPSNGEILLGETVKLSYVDQSRDDLNNSNTVWEEISGGQEIVKLGELEVNSRAYCSSFNFKGSDQQKPMSKLSGGERNRVHIAKMLKSGGNVLMLDEPTNDLDVETLSALEYAISEFAGSAMVISHDRFFLNRICTHILAFEGDSHVEWFEGDYDDYIKDKKRRLGEDAVNPKRTKYRKFVV